MAVYTMQEAYGIWRTSSRNSLARLKTETNPEETKNILYSLGATLDLTGEYVPDLMPDHPEEALRIVRGATARSGASPNIVIRMEIPPTALQLRAG